MGYAVAQRIGNARARRRRTLEERVLAGIPGLYRLLARFVSRLGPRVRVRQWLVRRQALSGWAASSRGDFSLMKVRYAPEMVYEFNPELVTLGLPARIEGRDTWLDEIAEFLSAWQEWSYTLSYILDLGERVVTLGRARFRGSASGVELEIDYAQLMELRHSLVYRERDLTDWSEALNAAGLDPALLSRLESLAPGEAMAL